MKFRISYSATIFDGEFYYPEMSDMVIEASGETEAREKFVKAVDSLFSSYSVDEIEILS